MASISLVLITSLTLYIFYQPYQVLDYGNCSLQHPLQTSDTDHLREPETLLSTTTTTTPPPPAAAAATLYYSYLLFYLLLILFLRFRA